MLTFVGVSKPAKAFLLAQSDAAPTTFAVPDRLAEDAEISIAASNSTNGITSSLNDSFAAKYPDAAVEIDVQDSGTALQNVVEGNVDLAAIGRSLTAQEKAQGLISVPVSREKIAIVVSKNNPYDGNLTIGEFSQIFRGEITNWSEIGGASRAIRLVDLPDSNDTRTAFPNYPVFQSAEFITGATAQQVQSDSTEAMIAELGDDGIGYAVANDVIGRDDVKIVTMHQTQPDDQRYPFSQPFSLVYQGTPSEAAQAYLGYATGEGGQEIVADRVGSISTAAVTAIAPAVGAGLAGENGLDTADTATIPEDDADVETEATADNPDDVVADAEDIELELDAEGTDSADSADSADVETEATADNPDDVVADAEDTELELDAEGTDSADSADVDTEATADNSDDVVADADVDTEVNSDLEDSGTVNSDLDGSGAVNSDLEESGTVNSDLDGSGTVNSDLEESGTVNPALDGSGEPLSSAGTEGETVIPNETTEGAEETEVAAKKGRWWLWLLPLLAIPLLVGAKAIFGGGAKSDREPALSNVPNVNSPEGGISVPGMSGGGNVPPVGTNVNGGNLANMAEGAVGTTSRMGAAGLAAGGAALAGGAAAAANLAGKRGRVENQADADLDLELDLDETQTVEEIPSNPVTEFTEQETNLQTDDVDFDGIDSGESTMPPTDSAIAMGAAGIGAVATSGFTPSQTDDSETTDFDLDTSTEEPSSDQTTELTTPTQERTDEIEADPASQVVSAEFRGDYVLPEETSTVLGGSNTVFDTAGADLDTDVDTDADSGIDLDTDNISANVATPDVTTPDVDLPDVVSPEANGETGILDGINRAGGAAIAGGAAAVGGAAAAASGLFNRGQDAVEDAADTSIDAPDVEVDANLEPNLDVDTTTPDLDIPTGIDAETNLDLSDSAQDSDLNIDGVVGDVSADVNTPDVDLSLDTPEVELPDIDLPRAEGGTGLLDGVNRAGGAAIAGGAAALGGAAAAASGLFNRGQDAVEDAADTSIDAPDVNLDSNLDADLDVESDLGDRTNDIAANITGIEGEVAAPNLDISTEIDTGIEPGIDTGINPPDLAQNTDLNLGRVDVDEISGSVTTPDLDLPQVDLDSTVDGVTDSITTPDLDLPNVNPPSAEDGTGIIDGVNRAGGAAVAGGAAALGGAAAAASGLFNRGRDTVEDAADTSVDASDVDLNPNLETNLDVETSVDNPANDIAADVSARVGDINTPDLDVSTGINADVNLPESALDTDLNLDFGGTVDNVSGNITTPEANLPTDVDISLDTPDIDLDSNLDSNLDLSSDPGNVAENATASNLDLSSLDLDLNEPTAESGTGIFEGVSRAGGAAALGGAAAAASGLFKSDEQSDSDIQEFETFETSFDLTADTTPTSFADNVVGDAETTSIEEVNIDDITLDNVADTAELNLEGMTLSDTDSSVDTSLEQITFDDAGEINLDEITLDSSDQTDVSLEDIDFDGGTAALNLEEISFDDAEANLSSELDLNVSQTNESAEISLDDLGFEESEQASSFDLLGDNTAEITSFSDDQSNDMTNISEWLDSLETPNKDSDNIADWLDTLDKDSADSNPNPAPNNLDEDTNDNLTAEADDISFQFLEDLLDRDSDGNRNDQ
ncbi:MAG: substrate-binding domain-containing protein [Cyanobacteria bacterium J06555_3]